eukprot:12585506-Prorocentrum_lima.AAC.1
MTSSLVGSEMCIRDSPGPVRAALDATTDITLRTRSFHTNASASKSQRDRNDKEPIRVLHVYQ